MPVKNILKNSVPAALLLVAGLCCAGALRAQERSGGKDKPAPAEKTVPAARQNAAPQPDTNESCSGSDDKFKEDIDSVGDSLRGAMGDLRKPRPKFPGAPSPEERAKEAKAEQRRLADSIEARLKKEGRWNTEAARQSMGMASYLRGDYDAAITQFNAAISKAPDANVKTWTLVDRGDAYFAKGDRAGAERDLDEALKSGAPDKGPNLAALAWKLGRIDDAKRETEAAAAYRRTKTPGFVANWSVCTNLEAIGKPAEGCLTRPIADCSALYGTPELAGRPACARYEAEMKFLAATGYPCSGGKCKVKVQTVPPPAVPK